MIVQPIKNFPMPAGRVTKYNWDAMEVGDAMPLPTVKAAYPAAKYLTAAKAPREFVAKSIDGKGYVWRVK